MVNISLTSWMRWSPAQSRVVTPKKRSSRRSTVDWIRDHVIGGDTKRSGRDTLDHDVDWLADRYSRSNALK